MPKAKVPVQPSEINAEYLPKPTLTPVRDLKLAPWNPRLIRDTRFRALTRSLQRDPNFLWQRPILAMADGTVYAGNMRLRAAIALGWNAVPAIKDDVSEVIAKERSLRDNNNWGEYNDQELAELLVDLQVAKVDVGTVGFDDEEITRLLDSVGSLGDTTLQYGDDERGRTAEEKKALEFDQTSVRMIVLYYDTDGFAEITKLLADLRENRGFDNNTDLVTNIIREAHAEMLENIERNQELAEKLSQREDTQEAEDETAVSVEAAEA
jgi:ParB-like chromosome segregation protein Spo0J